MKKAALFFVALCIIIFSCSKAVQVTLSYSVNTVQGNPIQNIYIPDSGSYDFQVLVKFLSGNTADAVTLSITGLPAGVSVTPDTFGAAPTYTANFVFTTTHATRGAYPITIRAYTPTVGYTNYNVTLNVIPADCATLLTGSLTGSNACTARKYTYTATASATGTPNTISVNNFGGYGSGTNALISLNCDNDSLFIAYQNIGNGTMLSGSGTFTPSGMVVYYTAANTPGGFAETCTATFTK